MNKILNFLKTRWTGFYLTAAAALISLLVIICYPVLFAGGIHWAVWVMLFPLIGLIVGAGLFAGGFFVKDLDAWASAAIGAGGFLGLLSYMTKMFDPFIQIYGPYHTMDAPSGIIAMIVLFTLIIAVSIAGIFLKQTKAQE